MPGDFFILTQIASSFPLYFERMLHLQLEAKYIAVTKQLQLLQLNRADVTDILHHVAQRRHRLTIINNR